MYISLGLGALHNVGSILALGLLTALTVGNLAAAAPTLELITETITNCGDVKFKYGGGTPPYKFNAVTAYLPTQTLMLSDREGEGSWQCTFPRNNPGSKTITNVTFYLEDATKAYSTATELYEVFENTGSGCPEYKYPPFMWMWSTRMYGEPGPIIPECKSLIFSTELDDNVNSTIHFPISVTGVIPGGEVWTTVGTPETPELIERGNQVIFLMRDFEENEGGSSNLKTVIPGTECGRLHTSVKSESSKRLGPGVIAGIVVGSVGAVAALLLALYAFLRWHRHRAAAASTFDFADGIDPVVYQPTPFVAHDGSALSQPSDFVPPTSMAATTGSSRPKSSISSAMLSTGHTSLTMPRDSWATGKSTVTARSLPAGAASPGMPASPQMSSIHNMNPTYRVQDDAGPVPAEPVAAGPVVDLPPTYNQAWVRDGEGSQGASREKGAP